MTSKLVRALRGLKTTATTEDEIMSEGYINIGIKEKFNGSSASRKHLTNKGKHILRQHSKETLENMKQKSFDPNLSSNNSTLISYQKPGETLNQTVDRFIEEQGIDKPARNTSIRAVAGIISIPSDCLNDKSKLEIFEKKAKEFLETNDKLKGNVILAQTNFDETQPHIEFIFVPRDNENPKKLDFSKLYGTDLRKGYDGSKSLEKLHDQVAEEIGKPLGLKRGDGTNTKGLSNEEYRKTISDMKKDEKTLNQLEIKEPPKPIQLPEETLFNKGKIIELQKQEIKELRKYIKETKNDRNNLRSAKGILAQNRQVRFDKRDLKKQLKTTQEENKIYSEALGEKRPKKDLLNDFKGYLDKRDKEREQEKKSKQEREERKQQQEQMKKWNKELEDRNKERAKREEEDLKSDKNKNQNGLKLKPNFNQSDKK
jgi:hypothetical protein